MPAKLERFAAVLATRYPALPEDARLKLAQYLELVRLYAKVVNLTGFSGTVELTTELVGESLKLLELGELTPGWRVCDLGSGNGSPVVPLAIMCPTADFIAVESRQRRATFLKQVQATLKLANLTVHAGRAEELLRDQPGQFELVTSRGFAQPAELLAFAVKLLALGGEVRGYLGAEPGPLAETAAAQGGTVVNLFAYQGQISPRHVYRLQF